MQNFSYAISGSGRIKITNCEYSSFRISFERGQVNLQGVSRERPLGRHRVEATLGRWEAHAAIGPKM